MDFFKAVFSDDPDPPKPGPDPGQSDNASRPRDREDIDRRSFLDDPESDQIPQAEGDSSITSSGWSFGGLIRNLTSKSESVIETYRRDLQEFGSGLRKELEVAQGSLGTVGSAIDELGNSMLKGTAQMIAHGKDAILAVDLESDSDTSSSSQNPSGQRSHVSKRYDRFDAQVRLIQNNVSTYSLGPEDVDDYNMWISEFSLEEKSEEIKGLLDENDAMLSVYKELVPNSIDYETFWFRYYYKVFKLKQAEDLRAKLVKRVISNEEELSWDVDDDEEEDAGRFLDGGYAGSKNSIVEKGSSSYSGGESTLEKSENLGENKASENDGGATIKIDYSVGDSKTEISIADEKVEKIPDNGGGNDGGVEESSGKKGSDSKRNGELDMNEAGTELNDNVTPGRRDDPSESKTEDNKEVSMVSSKPSIPEEEDLEWDEIEDLSTLDEKKPTKSGSPHRADLRKRLSTAEEEDLSWDIEDDDEPAKIVVQSTIMDA